MKTTGLIVNCLTTKYATFSGRASRKEFWSFLAFLFLFFGLAGYIDGRYQGMRGATVAELHPFISLLSLATLIPNIAVVARRLHDTNRSGWYSFIVLIPLIGLIFVLLFLCSKGTYGRNRFGSDPLNPDLPDVKIQETIQKPIITNQSHKKVQEPNIKQDQPRTDPHLPVSVKSIKPTPAAKEDFGSESSLAEAMSPSALFDLGEVHRQEGAQQDLKKAFKWYKLAEQMTPSQIAEAQRLAKEFKPKKEK